MLALIGTVLTGSRSARLVAGLKEHEHLAGLTYLVHADQANLKETGYFAIEAHTQTDTLRDIRDIPLPPYEKHFSFFHPFQKFLDSDSWGRLPLFPIDALHTYSS